MEITMRLSVRLIAMVITVLAIFTALPSSKISAHTIDFSWQCNGSSVTFYAGSYHPVDERPLPIGGLILNGVTHAFSGYVTSLPAIAGTISSGSYYSAISWQTVTIPGLSNGVYAVTTTQTSQVEAPLGPPLSITISCIGHSSTVAISVWGAVNVTGISWQYMADDGKWWWFVQSDAKTKIVTPIEYRDRVNNQGKTIPNYSLSRLIVDSTTAPTDPKRYKAYNATTLQILHQVWIEVGSEASPDRKAVFIP